MMSPDAISAIAHTRQMTAKPNITNTGYIIDFSVDKKQSAVDRSNKQRTQRQGVFQTARFAPLITGRKAINNPVSAIIFLYLLADLSDKQATSRNRKTAEILYFQGFLPFWIYSFSNNKSCQDGVFTISQLQFNALGIIIFVPFWRII